MKNKYKIRIKDTAGVEQLVDFDYRKKHVDDLFYKVWKKLKDIIEEKVDLLSDIFDNQYEREFIFSLEPESDNGKTLAVFRPSISKPDALRFSIYYNSIKDLCDYIVDEKEEASIYEFEDTILHELIHASDIETIKKENQVLTQIYDDYLKDSFNTFDNTTHSLFQYFFMLFFKVFRTEGVAILGTNLLGKTKSDNLTKEDAFLHFRFILIHLIETINNINPDRKMDFTRKREQVRIINNQAYQYANIILLFVMNEMLALDVDKYYDFLQNKPDAAALSQFDKINLVKQAVKFDLSQYIHGLLKLKIDENTPIFDHKYFMHICANIQEEKDVEGINIFVDNIINAGKDNDKDKFIDTIRTILGMPMSVEEIRENITKLKNKKQKDNILLKSIRIAEHLLNRYDKSEPNTANAKLIIWTLTYFFDTEEIIYDHLPLLGYQDDLFVLEIALDLLNKS